MIFLPYERFVIKTQLDTQTILERLAEATETSSRWTFFWEEHKPYRGKIVENRFEIYRWISYRNSFLPMIKGRVNPDVGGSIVFVTMNMHWLVIIFLCIWFGGVFSFFRFAIGEVLSALQSNLYSPEIWIAFAIPVGFLLFGYTLTMVGFKIESVKSRRFIENLLEAHDVIDLNLLETELNT